jgi:dTDP-4-amino-4,6-dideoxygalactose transaminase
VKVPLVDLVAQHRAIEAEVVAAAMEVVAKQAFVLGEPVKRFERALAEASGTAHAVGVASGTDALALALQACGVGAGDAVITTPFSFVATAEAIVAVGARPIFADVEPETLLLSAARVEARILRHDAHTHGRLRAIMPVHLFGACADMNALGEIARRFDLAVVEDAAQAMGATFEGRAAGSMGDAGCLSFFPTKTLGAWGDGGAVITSRDDVALSVSRLRVHGASGRGAYVHDAIGKNSRLDALQAAVLGAKLPHLASWNASRERLVARYRERLADLSEQLLLPARPGEGSRHVYTPFVVRVMRPFARDLLKEHLASRGIESRVYYPVTLDRQPCFASLAEPAMPIAHEAARTCLALPLYPELSSDAHDFVIDSVRGFFIAAR